MCVTCRRSSLVHAATYIHSLHIYTTYTVKHTQYITIVHMCTCSHTCINRYIQCSSISNFKFESLNTCGDRHCVCCRQCVCCFRCCPYGQICLPVVVQCCFHNSLVCCRYKGGAVKQLVQHLLCVANSFLNAFHRFNNPRILCIDTFKSLL